MSFRKGDLFVVSCALVAVGCMVSMFVASGSANTWLYGVSESVTSYLAAPQRVARLEAEVKECDGLLAVARRDLKSAHERLDSDATQHRHVLDAAKAQIAVAEGERDRLFAELASLRSRHATLCQQLLELGNDVPSVLAGE